VSREQKKNKLHLVVEGNHAGSTKEGGSAESCFYPIDVKNVLKD